jgi:hypothetical protein
VLPLPGETGSPSIYHPRQKKKRKKKEKPQEAKPVEIKITFVFYPFLETTP